MQDVDLLYAIGLKPETAIAYLKGKGYELSWDWFELWQDAHAKAFTVAKVLDMDVLQDIRNAVETAIDEGLTLEQFRKGLTPTLQAKGWWGKETIGDKEVQLGSPRRLQTIYEANLQTAYSVGRYKSFIENVDNRPYWQYVAVLDSHTRPAHAALNGKVFRYDDPFWDSFYPPNGWRCRCSVRALSQANLGERSLSPETSDGKLDKVETLVSAKTGELIDVTQYTDPFTGYTVKPDVGWDYNPGKAAYRPDLNGYAPDIRRIF